MQNQSTPDGQSVQMTPEKAIKLAVEYCAKGQLEQSVTIAKSIIKAIPDHADAIHLLGVVASQQDALEEAVEFTARAIKLRPKNVQYINNLAEMYRRLKRLDDAEKYAMQALDLNPRSSAALSNLGIIYYDKKEFEQAKEQQLKALKYDRKNIHALNNLGSICKENKDLDGAIDYYRKVLEIDPDYIESRNNLGGVMIDAEQAREAIEVLLPIVHQNPRHAEAHRNLGRAFMQQEEWERAERGLRTCLEIEPQHVKAKIELSRVLQELRKTKNALEAVQEAVELEPDAAGARMQLGQMYSENGDSREAGAEYNRALELDPELLPAYMARGHWYMEEGRFDQARSDFEHVLESEDGDLFSVHTALVNLDKVTEDNKSFHVLKAMGSETEEMLNSKLISYHFAMGKSYDDLGDHDKAFEHFDQGCHLKRGSVDYDPQIDADEVDGITKVFTPDRIEEMRAGAIDAVDPIFVVGMPRSGTTLTETILGSHPDVYPAGELPDLNRTFSINASRAEGGFVTNADRMSAEALGECAQDYVDVIRKIAPGSARVSDKMPANYRLVGFIHALMPNAKIIHIQRDPLDTCLSNYTKLFRHSLYQTYDQQELGRYYNGYLKVMQHWREVLPEDAIYELEYEKLVSDNEAEVCRVLEYCGLEWDNACIEFFKTKRNVRTASVTQVRQPIYTSSVQRWRRYEKHLGPLMKVLGV